MPRARSKRLQTQEQAPGSELERAFDTYMRQLAPELPAAVPEHRFAPPRRWKFDRAWPDRKIAIELEGGTWSGGRHVRPQGFEDDCHKYNCAAVEGWRLLRFTGRMLHSDPAACVALIAELFEEALCQRSSSASSMPISHGPTSAPAVKA